MKATFYLIDLVSQCAAVERRLAGMSKAQKIDWLSAHGRLAPDGVDHGDRQSAVLAECRVGVRAGLRGVFHDQCCNFVRGSAGGGHGYDLGGSDRTHRRGAESHVARQIEEGDPVMRILCTIGMLLIPFGNALLPSGHNWAVLGIAIVAFFYLIED